MAVVVTTTLEPEDVDDVLSEINRISVKTHELTPRSVEALRGLLVQNNLVMVFVDGQLAGWGVREPLARGVFELGMTFVRPEFRSTTAFDRLAHELVSGNRTFLVATYKPELVRYLEREFGFRQSHLTEFIWLSRGRFLSKRLSRESRRAVRSHLKNAKPFYTLKDSPR